MQNKMYDAESVSSCTRCGGQVVARGWVFDLDGVLINLRTKRVTEECVIGMLAERLECGEPVTFNTGRSPGQAFEHILRPLACLVDDERLLKHVMIAGEKGGAWATYEPGRGLHVSFDPRFSLPPMLLEEVQRLILSSDYADVVEIEQGKQTMISLVVPEGGSFELFQKAQGNIAALLQHYLTVHDFASTWKVDVNGSAVEIEHRLAGKGLGAQRIITWMQAQRICPSQVIAFGDSLSDLPMGDVLSHHFPVEFVFVGASEIVDSVYTFPIKMQGRYEHGTIEYLLQSVPSVHVLKEV